MVYDNMRAQVRMLRGLIMEAVPVDDPSLPVMKVRLEILSDAIDDLEAGRLPVGEHDSQSER